MMVMRRGEGMMLKFLKNGLDLRRGSLELAGKVKMGKLNDSDSLIK